MSGILNLTSICDQRRQLQLFNKPLPRYTPISPYPLYTQFQLNMRRKAEILRYSSNTSSSQTNNLTRKEKWAKFANAKNNKIVNCPNDLTLPTLSSSCDVPGPITVLYNDNTVPLYNFASNIAAYAVDNTTEVINYNYNFVDNNAIQLNNESTIVKLYIENNENKPIHNFSIETPIAFHINGSNINKSPPYNLQILLSSISLITYYSGQQTLVINDPPIYQFNTMNTPINLTLSPPSSSNPFSFSAFIYAGILKISNINLYTEPGFIYDIKLSFNSLISSSNISNPSIINNTNIYMYTNLTKELYNDIITSGGKPFNNTNPYNCIINSGISNDPYIEPILKSNY